MLTFDLHTADTAPEGADETLRKTAKSFGFVPNLYATLAESPAAVEAYSTLSNAFGKSGFSPAERQVVLIAISAENGCHYCVAAHSTVAANSGLDDADIEALRSGKPLSDDRLEALRTFTLTVVRERGWVAEETVEAFLKAGFTKANVLEVIVGASLKTISNYVNHIAETPLDDAFKARAWSREG